jgi:tRNA (guanine26-N2/guanine27-N2)-dimethyltransferase
VPRLALTVEGSTELLVPAESLGARAPATSPAFFNPAARVNRDISVAVASATRPRDFLDALAGVGARGVRVAKEVGGVRVTMVDFNSSSVEIARRNIRRNRVSGRCRVVREETNVFMHSRFRRSEKFACVDVDPFGAPAQYVQGALVAAADGAVVSMTATDTAVLCGTYPSVAFRRYGVRIQRSEFMHEAGIRALLGFCARVGGALDVGVRPVAAHSTLHYMRVYLKVTRRASASERAVRSLGYVISCGSCHEKHVLEREEGSCPSCGAMVRPIGPLWVGAVADEGLVGEAAGFCSSRGWEDSARVLLSLRGVDACPPYSHSIEEVASREGLSSVRIGEVVERLRGLGRKAVRQPFGAAGVKTDAPYSEVLGAVRGASAEYPRQTR